MIVGARACGALQAAGTAQAAGRPARRSTSSHVSGGESCSDRRSHPLRGVPGSMSFTRAVPRLEGEGSMKVVIYTESHLDCISMSR